MLLVVVGLEEEVLERVGMAKEEEVRRREGRPRWSSPGSGGGLLWVRPIREGVARVVVLVVLVLG